MDDASERLAMTELWSLTAVLNTASQAVMRRVGMTEYARFDHPSVALDDPVRPCVVYRIDQP